MEKGPGLPLCSPPYSEGWEDRKKDYLWAKEEAS